MRLSGVPIDIHWEPYFLDKTTPIEGRDLQEYLMSKYGRAAIERFSAPDNPLDMAGRKVGIQFNKRRRVINTIDAHRAMEWCKENRPELADTLMEKLFFAYFTEAKDLCNMGTLLEVCESADLDRAALEAVLRTGLELLMVNKSVLSNISLPCRYCFYTDKYKDIVLHKDGHMKDMRISGVPFFFIFNHNGRPTTFSGAQVIQGCLRAGAIT